MNISLVVESRVRILKEEQIELKLSSKREAEIITDLGRKIENLFAMRITSI
jgi:hypothetical protein